MCINEVRIYNKKILLLFFVMIIFVFDFFVSFCQKIKNKNCGFWLKKKKNPI
jgi:hypothetical protein